MRGAELSPLFCPHHFSNSRAFAEASRFNQNGRCPQCGQKITPETGWHLHHRVWVVNGGDDSMANLVVMHPICHMQLHRQTDPAKSYGCCTASSEEGV
jgi:predicted SprT family Zn-dependent metalloprotease